MESSRFGSLARRKKGVAKDLLTGAWNPNPDNLVRTNMKILIERNRNAMASQANSINPRVSFIDTEQELVCDDNACHKSQRRKFEGRKHREESWDGSKLDRNGLMVRACKWDP